MRCSIIIPTFNRKDTLRTCLAAVTRQDYPDYEVVVVDDASTDGSAEMIRREFPNVLCLRQALNGGQVRARNRAIGAVTGTLLVFTDDDCAPAPGWLRRHASAYDTARIGAVGGPQVPSAYSFYDQYFVAHYPEEYRGCRRIERITGWERLVSGNMSVPRAVFDHVGLFDEYFLSGSDADLVRRICRAGYVVISDAALGVRHHKTYTLRSFLAERFRKASGSLLTDVKEGTLHPRRFTPLVNPLVTWRAWRNWREMFDATATRWFAFWGLAVLDRWAEVAGRGYYYWVLGRRYERARPNQGSSRSHDTQNT